MSIREAIINSLFLPASFWKSARAHRSEADFICPQAFGRNTYPDKSNAVYTVRDLVNNDIATFEWLQAKKFDPGNPNRILGLRCTTLAKYDENTGHTRRLVRPVIGQWEMLYVMWLYAPDWYKMHQKNLFVIWPPIEGYLATHGLLLKAREIAETHGWKVPLLIAHPEHIQRCFFIAQKIFGKSSIVWFGSNAPTSWFDSKSVQPWTRDPKRWLLYEMLARIHHRLHGWM